MLHTDMQSIDSRGLTASAYDDPRLRRRTSRHLSHCWEGLEALLTNLNRHSAIRKRRALELMQVTPNTLQGTVGFAVAPQFELSPLFPQRLDPSTMLRFRSTFWGHVFGDTQTPPRTSSTERTPIIAISWQSTGTGDVTPHGRTESYDVQTGRLGPRTKPHGYDLEASDSAGDTWCLERVTHDAVMAELTHFVHHYRVFLDRLVHIEHLDFEGVR